MLLLPPFLAVVFSALLVSAFPDPYSVQGADEAELTDSQYSSVHEPAQLGRDDEQWEWAPKPPQFVMDDAPVSWYATQDYQDEDNQGPIHFPDVDIPHPEPPPHEFPKPPKWPGPPKKGPHGPFPGPHHPPEHPHPSLNTTIYQLLESSPKFSRIFKLVNYTEEITSLLNDSSTSVTFFATPDWAFPKPEHPPPHRPSPDDEEIDLENLLNSSGHDVSNMLAVAEGLLTAYSKPNKDALKKILTAILKYQILPANLSTFELAKNTTYPTSLIVGDGSLDGEPLRLRVGKGIGPRLTVNVFADIFRGDIVATNGLIHVTNRPVLPMPSVFQAAFLTTDVFSTLTSAIQHSGLTEALEWSDVGLNPVKSSSAVTFFAPTNRAFAALPHKLRLFFFSPFGEKALKKLLQFHIVPEFVLHSDYLHNASGSDTAAVTHDAAASEMFAHLDYSGRGMPEAAEPSSSGYTRHRSIHGSARSRHSEMCKGRKDHQDILGHDMPDNDLPHPPPMPGHHMPPPPPGRHLPHPPPGRDMPPPPPMLGCHLSHPPPMPGHDMPHPPPPPPGRDMPHDPPMRGCHLPHPPPMPGCDMPHPSDDHKKLPRPFPKPDVVYSLNVTAPTLLSNHTLDVHVVQFAHKSLFKHYSTAVFVHGVHAEVPDLPMRNGVIHVIDRILNPLKAPGGPKAWPDMFSEEEEDSDDEWANWEEWLPRWAEE